MFKWMPYKEEETCERKLVRIMRRLKIEDFTFNYDRTSCYIEFQYKNEIYKLEHSVQKAAKKGRVVLRNGLDCLNELVQSLEDLSQIIDRGTYKLENWIAGMKKSSSSELIPEYTEEVHIRYQSVGKSKPSDYQDDEDFVHASSEPSLKNFDRRKLIDRIQNK
ncbi:hypothetical protein ACJ2A9_01375 [Anaerobacillus sp. MEB173]|uniref:hypothetical protein n=1 Tax=Anaerobacillus sp. MEB173 TaxID=3383345 RepID=UPI003F93860A